MLYESVCHLRYMNESVLFDPYINERSEIRDISHATGKFHSFFQVFHRKYIRFEQWCFKIITNIPCRGFQCLYDIFNCGYTCIEAGGHFYDVDLIQLFRHGIRTDILFFKVLLSDQCICSFIVFRMDRSLVKRLAALRNPQEADALFKCLSSESWYFPYILPGLEAIVLLTVFHDIFAD